MTGVIVGTELFSDLLAPGSSELRVVSDPEAVGGAQLVGGGTGLSAASVPQPAAFGELFRTGRARLLQLHKPPPPSSALFFELTQQVAAANGGSGSDGDGYDSVVSQLVILDVEVGMHGDPLWNAMRQTLSSASQQQPLGGASGASLLLRDALGGNARTLLLGCVQPADYAESAATLQLLSLGRELHTFPLVNDKMARGLLHRYHRQLHALHELLSAAEGKLSRGVEQLSQDREQLPQRVLGATDRLQSVVDQMQQDAAGAASEKQTLMAEVLQLRHKVNDSIGEARALKAELLDEKKEKQSMAKELIAAQIGANEKATAQQLRLNELEQQNLATSDVLAQLEVREAEGAAKLKAAVEAEEEGARRVRRAEQARLVLSAQNQSLAAEAEEAAEREDALNLQLLNATNAQAKAERELAEAQAIATSSESECARQKIRADDATADLEAARAEVGRIKSELQSVRLEAEKAQLQLEQDMLAVQRQAGSSAEQQLQRVSSLQADVIALREQIAVAEAAAATSRRRAEEEVSRLTGKEQALQTELTRQLHQVGELQRHVRLLADGTDNATAAAAAAAAGPSGAGAAAKTPEKGKAKKEKPAKGAKGKKAAAEAAKREAEEKAQREAEEAAAAEAKAAAEGAPAAAAPSEAAAVKAELIAYEATVNAALEANRALVEAYWTLRELAEEADRLKQPLVLPPHAELLTAALVEPGTGRRAVPSEAEKGLMREREQLKMQLARAHAATDEQQQRVQHEQERQQRESLRGSRAEEKLKEQLEAAQVREGELNHRIRALEEGGNAKKEVEALKATQEDLLKQLADLKGAGDWDYEREKLKVPELEKQKMALEQEVGQLKDQLAKAKEGGGGGGGGGGADSPSSKDGRPPPINLATGGTPRGAMSQMGPVAPSEQHLQPKIIGLEMQVRELTSTQGQLERERSVLKRRCVDAEEQLAAIQGYLGTHIGRYQKEILRLRERLNYLEKA